MTTITRLTTTALQEMMGAEATNQEARIMMGILSRECVTDTDDIKSGDWESFLEEAIATAERETDES